MVWAIILAAGESKRMGSPKLLLPYNGKTIIETVVSHCVNSNLSGTLLVVGAVHKEIEEKIKDYPVSTVYNPDFRSGMLSSIKCGFRAVPEDAGAVMVLLGDQPAVSGALINLLLKAFAGSKKGIVIPVHKSKRGHPIIIDMKYRDRVLHLRSESTLRTIIHSHTDDILEVEADSESVLIDIDDREDYRLELQRKKRGVHHEGNH